MQVTARFGDRGRLLAQQFKAQRGRPRGDLPGLIHKLGLEQSLLNQPWPQLSVPLRCSPLLPARPGMAMLWCGRSTLNLHVLFMCFCGLQPDCLSRQHAVPCELRRWMGRGAVYMPASALGSGRRCSCATEVLRPSATRVVLQGGQAQRIVLAIAIALKPDILLLVSPPGCRLRPQRRRAPACLLHCPWCQPPDIRRRWVCS